MVDYKKGIKVAKGTVNKFTFNEEGESKFGSAPDASHELKGLTRIHDVMTVEGDLVLQNRLAGTLFGAPQVDGQTAEGEAALQDLKDNAGTKYEGFLIYLTNASTTVTPFVDNQKFYFCEDGVWYPSPFLKVDAAADGDYDGIPDIADLFVYDGFGDVVFTGYTANMQSETMFELDGEDVMLKQSPALSNTNLELESGDLNGDVVPAAS